MSVYIKFYMMLFRYYNRPRYDAWLPFCLSVSIFRAGS